MKQFPVYFILLFTLLFETELHALRRDYHGHHRYCISHAPLKTSQHIDLQLLHLIPAKDRNCDFCDHPSIYEGYLAPYFKRSLPHLKKHLEYCKAHPDCTCYWPEHSAKAAKISDLAYSLFKDLIFNTALSALSGNIKEQNILMSKSDTALSEHGMVVSLIARQFHFSHYHRLCQNIANYSKSRYSRQEMAQIQDKLDDILEKLFGRFYSLYKSCYTEHPNADIKREARFMRSLAGLSSALKESEGAPNDQERIQEGIGKSHTEVFLARGTIFNQLMLYPEAIKSLTQAIQADNGNKNAYIERAFAYFETGRLGLALQDYESAKELTIRSPSSNGTVFLVADPSYLQEKAARAFYVPEKKFDFSTGLVRGTIEGATVSTVEFIPSTLSCCRGILHGLWAFALSPSEASQDMIDAAYAVGAYFYANSAEECLACVVPEIRELSQIWHEISDYVRGQKIGYIIGKYGVDIFVPIGIIKGVKKIQALRRANTMCTLETCAMSQVKQEIILKESAKRASLRAQCITEASANDKILVANSNNCHHIMQKKHRWDKVVELSGNVEEDIKKVLVFLEENNIRSDMYLGEINKLNPNLLLKPYERICGDHKIIAQFAEHLDRGEIFLNNAWIEIIK